MYNFKCLSYKYLRNKIAKNYYICTHLKKLEKNNKLKERRKKEIIKVRRDINIMEIKCFSFLKSHF